MCLLLRKCKNDGKILKIILVPTFCPLKPEIALFSIRFCLNVDNTGSACAITRATQRLVLKVARQ